MIFSEWTSNECMRELRGGRVNLRWPRLQGESSTTCVWRAVSAVARAQMDVGMLAAARRPPVWNHAKHLTLRLPGWSESPNAASLSVDQWISRWSSSAFQRRAKRWANIVGLKVKQKALYVLFKRVCSPENEHFVIIYSLSCRFKPILSSGGNTEEDVQQKDRLKCA